MDFNTALAAVGEWEGIGKYTDDKNDPGGATNHGITRATLELWWGRKVTKDEVKALSWEESCKIYRAFYWDIMRCDELPAVLRLAVFDCAVNQGVGRSTRLLQKSVGAKPDGVLGPNTMGRIWERAPFTVLRDFSARRAVHYSSLGTILRYGYGWFRRMFDIHRRCVQAVTS